MGTDRIRHMLLSLIVAVAALAPAGCDRSRSAPRPERHADVAASNSMLECAAKDLLGEATPVLRLAEPGMCPGHFDLRPSQVEQLRHTRVLLRLDFQKSLDSKLASAADEGLHIAEVRVSGGLSEPDSYLQACRQTADALIAAGLLDRAAADLRLAVIRKRVQQTAARCLEQVEGLRGAPVVASTHQQAFCKWLGLRPVAEFSAADSARASQIERAIRQGQQAGAMLVIANRPEGRRLADALAERLGARVAVFGNFPSLDAGHASFDDLVEANVRALLEAAKP